MEVFSKYFGRLVTRNGSHIFSGAKTIDSGNYRLLQEEMDKVIRDPSQAPRIAEAIDISEGDSFRDFDLPKFIDHFELDTIAKCVLAVAFRTCNRVELRQKGMSRYSFEFDATNISSRIIPRDVLYSITSNHP